MKAFAQKALFISILGTLPLIAQVSHAEAQDLLGLVKELQVQQTQIADNETKIETKIASAAETIRIARIYASRLGGPHKPPPPIK